MKNLLFLGVSTMLGLLCASSVSAQLRLPKGVVLPTPRISPPPGANLGANLSANVLDPNRQGLLKSIINTPGLPKPSLPQPFNPTPNPRVFGNLHPDIIRQVVQPGNLNLVPGSSGGIIPLPEGPIQELNPPPTPQPPRNNRVQFGLGPQGPTLGIPTGNGQLNIPLGRRAWIGGGVVVPQQPVQVIGYGPQGQIYTADGQVMGSALAPGRGISQFNGTQRQVQQPIYDNFGNIVGYQEGQVWNNSITGQQHGNITTYTPNGSGGYHQSTTLYQQAGGNITPMTGN